MDWSSYMFNFVSRRSTVLAKNGMVATSQPLASQSGLEILKNGGNAVDAAVATAAVLNVVEPMSTGIGGDMFALYWDNKQKKVFALNGSGSQSRNVDIKDLTDLGLESIPNEKNNSHFAVSVPGTVDGWESLIDKFGSMKLSDVLFDSINYAEKGFPVSEIISKVWSSKEVVEKLRFRKSGEQFLPNGNPPKYGEIIKLPNLAKSLRIISEGGSEAFYKGEIASSITNFIQSQGGWLCMEDLAKHKSEWVDPISTNYRGYEIWECPPNGAGIIALMALNIVENFDINSMGLQSAETYHHLIESMRLAFSDGLFYVADPNKTHVPVDQLLSKNYASKRVLEISSKEKNSNISYGNPLGGSDTVYLSVIDREGNACSFINSLYSSFGTGLVVPEYGIALQNRGSLFSLDPEHPNYLEPSKKPYHTIIPGMATKDGELSLSFGVMGGFQQPQGHLQTLVNMIDFDLDPQQALDALRFRIDVEGNGVIHLEEGVSSDLVNELKKRGHEVNIVSGYDRISFGGGQIISRDPSSNLLMGGTEPRKDGIAVGW